MSKEQLSESRNSRLRKTIEHLRSLPELTNDERMVRICVAGLGDEAIEVLAAAVSERGTWRPVSEKPTERGEYFVYCTNTGNRTILAWNGELWIESLDTKNPDGYWTKFVSHWQRMPDAPAERNG